MRRTKWPYKTCLCGCGSKVSGVFKRGHHMLTKEGKEHHVAMLKAQNRRGEKHHSWKGGEIIHEGRVMVRVDDGYEYRARVVMEKYLGRKLERGELVHHKNENTLDDAIENLEVKNISEHVTHHKTGFVHSEESKRRMSENRKGLTAGKNNPMYGKRHTEETVRKISAVRSAQERAKRLV